MTLLNAKTAIILKNAKLPQGVSRFTVPWNSIPVADLARIKLWSMEAQFPSDQIVQGHDSWWSITETEEYGRTLWGPYVAQMPGDPSQAALIIGSYTFPVTNLVNYAVVADEEGLGFMMEWVIDMGDKGIEYISVPIRKHKTNNPGLKEVRAVFQGKGDPSKVLAVPMIMYPKLPSLAVGSYKVVGTFEYQGYNGKDYGLVIVVNGRPTRFQGNRETTGTLEMEPLISEENPATLTILSHGTTAQGHAKVAIKFEVQFPDVEGTGFDFTTMPEVPALGAGADDSMEGLDPAVEVEAEVVAEEPSIDFFGQAPEVSVKATRKRSR